MVTGSDIEFLRLIKTYGNWMSTAKFWRREQLFWSRFRASNHLAPGSGQSSVANWQPFAARWQDVRRGALT
jgi:hypothetical protein